MLIGEQMSTVRFPAEVKTRVSDETRQQLEALANHRQLSVSDIVREALREYADKRSRGELPEAGGVASVGSNQQPQERAA